MHHNGILVALQQELHQLFSTMIKKIHAFFVILHYNHSPLQLINFKMPQPNLKKCT